MAEAKREISGFFLSDDKFASLIQALGSPSCTTAALRLFHNEPHHSAAVLQALRSNASVTSFDIYELDSAAAASLAAVLAGTPCLTTLAVHHPHGHEAVAQLAQGLAANRSLTHLHLSQLDPRGVTAVASALSAWAALQPSVNPSHPNHQPGLARLQQLRLDKCAFTPEAATALAAALGPQAGALARLELVECDLGDAAVAALLAAPGWKALAAGGVLASLDLSSCHVGAQGAALLSRFLTHSHSLAALSLANNRSLGCAGAAALRPGLAAGRSLRRLDLSGCGIGASGVQALAAALRGDGEDGAAAAEPPPLQHLALSDNAGGAAGLLALLQSMSGARPCALQSLSLDRNHIRGVDFAQAVGFPAPPLPTLRSAAAAAAPPAAAVPATAPLPLVTAPLESLSLAGNALWDAGVAALAAALAAAPALEHLDLRENGVSDAGVTALLPLVAPAGAPRRGSGGGSAAAGGSRPGLAGLLLDSNRLHNAGGQALLEAVTAAPGLWRFSAEANKLTDPALRLSLTQLSQLRAARHSQLVVLGRQLSSSSTSSDDDASAGRRRSGGGGGGGASNGRSGGDDERPMDVDEPEGGRRDEGLKGSRDAGGNGGAGQGSNVQQQQALKHRLHERSEGGGGSSGDERPPLRNVAARGADAPAGCLMSDFANGFGGGSFGAPVSVAVTASSAQPMAIDVQCGGGGGSDWRNNGGMPYATAYSDRGTSSGGASSDGGSTDIPRPCGGGGGGAVAAAAAEGVLSSCLPPAVCFVTAVAGVGGAGSVGVSKRVGGGAAAGGVCDTTPTAKALPQQLLPASRRPRYKPLTPEQQRLFEDF